MNLVQLRKEEPITTSEVIASGTKRTHKSVIQLIRKYEDEIKEFGSLPFELRKSKGRPTEFVVLNESQVYFILTLMRNDEMTVAFKKKLVKEFMRMKKALLQLHKERSQVEWQEARKQGKKTRKQVTEVIQEFVQYATVQGSKNALRYYSNISRMENKALFILEQKYPNVREMLNYQQLSTLTVADKLVVDAIIEGMEKEMNYKDIYKLAKEKVEALASVIKPTMVISYDEVKVLKEG